MKLPRLAKDLLIPVVVGLACFAAGELLHANSATLLALAMFGFATPLLIMVVIRLDDWEKLLESRERSLEIAHYSNETLRRIHAGFTSVSEGGNAGDKLFEKFYRRKLAELCDHVSEAAQTGQIRIDVNHQYMTDTVLSVFDADDVDVFCETYIVEDENDMFDMHSLNYLIKVLKRVEEGSIRKVRSLFVFGGGAPARDSMFMVLCSLHNAISQLEFRIVPTVLYSEILRDANLQHEFIDFGLYGNELMFRTVTYKPSTSGFFSRHKPTIEQFQSFFDSCWNSPAAIVTELERDLDSGVLLQTITHMAKEAYNQKAAKSMPVSVPAARTERSRG